LHGLVACEGKRNASLRRLQVHGDVTPLSISIAPGSWREGGRSGSLVCEQFCRVEGGCIRVGRVRGSRRRIVGVGGGGVGGHVGQCRWLIQDIATE